MLHLGHACGKAVTSGIMPKSSDTDPPARTAVPATLALVADACYTGSWKILAEDSADVPSV